MGSGLRDCAIRPPANPSSRSITAASSTLRLISAFGIRAILSPNPMLPRTDMCA